MAKKHKKKRHLRIGRLLLFLVILLGLVYLGFNAYYRYSLKAVSSTAAETQEFTVADGSSAKSVCQQLEDEGLVRDGNMTYLYARINELTDIKAGTYELQASMDSAEILTLLNDATAALSSDVKVTIVEGDWAKHVAEKIAAVTNVTADELLALWNDQTYLESLMDTYPFLTEEMFDDNVRIYLEGYLAPNTYFFHPETTAEEVTEKILDQTLAVYNEYADQIAASSLSIHQIYTLASIVQYESGKLEDMEMIAGVFYNRLAAGMPLESSVTVCYAIDVEKDDDWMNCEVNSDYDSPYNTYLYGGLPPGPIENPGVDALYAVLNPTASSYYYFMADVNGDGTVYYAETIEEHNANVAKYLQ